MLKQPAQRPCPRPAIETVGWLCPFGCGMLRLRIVTR